jgi:hypothetical protein
MLSAGSIASSRRSQTIWSGFCCNSREGGERRGGLHFAKRNEGWNFHDAGLHGTSHYNLRSILRWLPPISVCTTFIIHAAGSLTTGCHKCYGITPNSLPLRGLRYSRALDVCARFYGMRGGVNSAHHADLPGTRQQPRGGVRGGRCRRAGRRRARTGGGRYPWPWFTRSDVSAGLPITPRQQRERIDVRGNSAIGGKRFARCSRGSDRDGRFPKT